MTTSNTTTATKWANLIDLVVRTKRELLQEAKEGKISLDKEPWKTMLYACNLSIETDIKAAKHEAMLDALLEQLER